MSIFNKIFGKKLARVIPICMIDSVFNDTTMLCESRMPGFSKTYTCNSLDDKIDLICEWENFRSYQIVGDEVHFYSK